MHEVKVGLHIEEEKVEERELGKMVKPGNSRTARSCVPTAAAINMALVIAPDHRCLQTNASASLATKLGTKARTARSASRLT